MKQDTPITVLLIEDNPTDVRLVQQILRGTHSDGFNIISTSTLAQGLERLSSDQADVILLDLGLPDSQGLDTFKVMREQAPALPIVVLTVSDDETLGQQIVQEGAQDYLPKNVLAQDTCTATLTRAIRYSIERKRSDRKLQQTHLEVQSLNEELQNATEELKQHIQERTEELNVANEELSATNEELRSNNEELKEEVYHRTRLERIASQNTERIELINRIITLANEHTDVRGYVDALLDIFVNELAFDTATLRLRRGDVAELYDSRGLAQELVEKIQRENVSAPPFNQIYRGEFYLDESYIDNYPLRGTEARVEIALGVPLITHGQVIGNFGLGGRHPHTFTNAELQTLTAIGHEVGTVIARLKAEEQVRAGSRYVRSLIEASLDPLVTISAEGMITDVNKATEDVTGCLRDDLIASDFSTYFTEPDKARAGYKQVFTEGSVRDYPLAIRHKCGRVTDVLYNASVYRNEAGEVQGVFAAARDITDRKRAEEELQSYSDHLESIVEERTAQLKDSERLAGIGQTAAMIGHDLRNPLQALQLLLDLGGKYYNHLSPEAKAHFDSTKADHLFSSVEKQIQYMDKIVSDLQDYARPLEIEREEVEIAALIDDTLSVLTIPEEISVHVDVPAAITATLDAHFMQRVLVNLIMNAVQAMPNGGELTIGAAVDHGVVVITVHDTGEGVPDAMKDTVFSPLTTGKAKGTGLGLAVVKRIVEAHNGTITFESEEGEGTTFTVTLPQHP
ncbi:MAG: ATP-binding protein [Halobacteriota archaeon]